MVLVGRQLTIYPSFFKNFAPLSPIVDDYYWYHQNHYQLITQEPLLCCSILSVSCRYHTLRGGGGPSRNVLLHQRIWRHCEHLVSRIVLGQEKRSKAKTRTFRSIQALLILTEWYPRAIHFPPEADGWDSSLIFLVPDERDEPGSNQADGAAHVAAKWLEDVVAPARMGDRMSWMFLGCAMSLGHELGVFQARTNDGPSGVRRHKDAANYPWMRKLLYIADQQFSARLNCTSMIPMSLDLSISDSAPSDDGPANFSSSLINSWFGLSQLARSISGTVFSSTAVTRQLLQSHGYVNVVRYFQQQLSRWRESNLDILGTLPPPPTFYFFTCCAS